LAQNGFDARDASLHEQLNNFIALWVIIEAMGVSLRDFQIADALILFLFAATMVIGERQESSELGTEAKNASGLAIYALAVPTLAGPGAMLTVMLLTDNSRFSILEQLLTTATVACWPLPWSCWVLGNPITRVIRPHGANVLKRIMGMILATVAVKIVLGGYPDWLHLPGNALMMLVRRGPPQWQALIA